LHVGGDSACTWVVTQAVEQRGEGDGGAAASRGGHLGHGYPAAGPGACPGACPGCPHGSPGTRGLPALPNSPGLLPCPHQVTTHSFTVFVSLSPCLMGRVLPGFESCLDSSRTCLYLNYISSHNFERGLAKPNTCQPLHLSKSILKFSIALQLCMLAYVHSFTVTIIHMNSHCCVPLGCGHQACTPHIAFTSSPLLVQS